MLIGTYTRPTDSVISNDLEWLSEKYEQSRGLSATSELLVFRTDEILYKKLADLFLSVRKTQLQLYFQRSLCSTLIWDIYLNDETETVSRMEKAGPFDCCCIHHSIGIAVSLLASGLTVDILSTFCAHSFYSLVCWVNAEKFWIWGFNVWPFCISPKCNISGTFHQVRALLSCLLNGLQIS